MSTPIDTVTKFCEAFSRRDVAELVGFFSEDAIYHNMPVAPVEGHEAIAKTLEGYLGSATAAEFELLHIAAHDGKVLTERVDRFTIGEKQVVLPVMGTFEVDAEGRITAWRDYFDMNQFMSQLG